MTGTTESIALKGFDDIETEVAEKGYCHISEAWDEARFRELCERFGEVFYEAEIRLGAERPRNYQLPQEIGFHTDHVTAGTAAWFCYVPDPNGGAMQLLDLGGALAQLSEAEISALCRVGVADNAAWGGGEPIALCAPTARGMRLHYVPWLDMFPADAEAGAALNRFNRLVELATRTELVDIELKTGDVVILDNHRVAHGRQAIAGTSPRHLKRLWMRREPLEAPAV